MAHKPSFAVGAVVSNDEMRKEFKIGNMGGMRKSNTYGCLVIISDHTKGLYEDKWYGDELHYTGMGNVGDQILTGNQMEHSIMQTWTIVNKKDTIFKYIFWERLDSLPIPECCFHFIWCQIA